MSESRSKDLVAFGYAPGNYTCKCVTCGSEFVGDKRAARCQGCAERLRAIQPVESRPSNERLGRHRLAIDSETHKLRMDPDPQGEWVRYVVVERLQADNERLMHHVRASPSLSNAYVNLAETEIDAQRRRANTLQDELRALKSSAHETTEPRKHEQAMRLLRKYLDREFDPFEPNNQSETYKELAAFLYPTSPEEPECQHDLLKPKTTIVVDPNDPFHASCSACKHDFRTRAPLETSSDGWKCVTCGHENPRGTLRCQNSQCTALSYSPEKATERRCDVCQVVNLHEFLNCANCGHELQPLNGTGDAT